MKIILFLVTVTFSNILYAECIDDPYEVKSDEDLRSAVFCLQQEITILKKSIVSYEQVAYVVQVATRLNNSSAKEIEDTFNTIGFKAMTKVALDTTSQNKEGYIYKVLIGPYKWKSEANDVKNTIRKNHPKFNDAFVSSIIVK